MPLLLLSGTIVALVAASCSQTPAESRAERQDPPPGAKSLVVAGGCFWCTEAVYEELEGVLLVESGYAGGTVPNPTYEEVCTGTTGHAEAIRIAYDPKRITEHDLLRIFLTVHDPTTLNRQGPDSGTQYRSAIFYSSPDEKALAQSVVDEVAAAKIWPNPIVTTLEPLKAFYLADESHQNYFDKFEKADAARRSRMNAGYCTAIIEPKVLKFRKQYADRLKKKE